MVEYLTHFCILLEIPNPNVRIMSEIKINHQDILDKIRNRDPRMTKQIYQDAFPKCARYILDNSGNYEQAQDSFQEAFVVLFEKSQQEDFKLNSDTST